jgi:hypothetical protein
LRDFFFFFNKQFLRDESQRIATRGIQPVIHGLYKTFCLHIRFYKTSLLLILRRIYFCIVKHMWWLNIYNSSIYRPRVLFDFCIIFGTIMIVIIILILCVIITCVWICWFTFVFGTHVLIKTLCKIDLRKFRTVHWSIIIELFAKARFELLTNILVDSFFQIFCAFAIAKLACVFCNFLFAHDVLTLFEYFRISV